MFLSRGRQLESDTLDLLCARRADCRGDFLRAAGHCVSVCHTARKDKAVSVTCVFPSRPRNF